MWSILHTHTRPTKKEEIAKKGELNIKFQRLIALGGLPSSSVALHRKSPTNKAKSFIYILLEFFILELFNYSKFVFVLVLHT